MMKTRHKTTAIRTFNGGTSGTACTWANKTQQERDVCAFMFYYLDIFFVDIVDLVVIVILVQVIEDAAEGEGAGSPQHAILQHKNKMKQM